MNHKSIAISQIALVVKDSRYALENLIIGLFVIILGLFMILMDFAAIRIVGIIFVILGLIAILDARKTTLIVSLNSGDHVVIPFIRFDRKKVNQAYEMINSVITERVSNTNVKEQANRVIETIQNDES